MKNHILTTAIMAASALLGRGFAQPNAPSTPNIPCSAAPTGAQNNDTVVSTPNSEGFFVLFDSRNMASTSTPRGWWQSCLTGHGGPAVFRVDNSAAFQNPANGAGWGAIYSTQNGNSGGLLMTNKLFSFYELVFDYWPDFGNDGGIFHRTTANGRCFQTVLDYLGGASLGGTWGEGGYIGRDQRPFSFGSNESTITISTDPNYGWTNFTRNYKAQNPTAVFSCPTSGCTQADWRANWSFNDWSQLRIKFYAGRTTASNVHMQSFFRRVGQTNWVPISSDTTLNLATPAGFIGLQVHGGGRFGAPRGTWYKRIWWRPTTELTGIPMVNGVAMPSLLTPVMSEAVDVTTASGKLEYDVRATSDALIGTAFVDHRITVRDLKGHSLESFFGRAGKFRYPFTSRASGWLTVDMKTVYGMQHFRVNRVIR